MPVGTGRQDTPRMLEAEHWRSPDEPGRGFVQPLFERHERQRRTTRRSAELL